MTLFRNGDGDRDKSEAPAPDLQMSNVKFAKLPTTHLAQQLQEAFSDKTGKKLKEFSKNTSTEYQLAELKVASAETTHPLSVSGFSRALHRDEVEAPLRRKKTNKNSQNYERNSNTKFHPQHCSVETGISQFPMLCEVVPRTSQIKWPSSESPHQNPPSKK